MAASICRDKVWLVMLMCSAFGQDAIDPTHCRSAEHAGQSLARHHKARYYRSGCLTVSGTDSCDSSAECHKVSMKMLQQSGDPALRNPAGWALHGRRPGPERDRQLPRLSREGQGADGGAAASRDPEAQVHQGEGLLFSCKLDFS